MVLPVYINFQTKWRCCKKYVYSKAHNGTVLVISMVQTKFKNRTLRKVSECISS